MSKHSLVAIVSMLALPSASPAVARQTAPPAPVLAAPANGASVLQPIALRWQAIVDPDGPIGSYSWEVSTSSTFGSIIASGFTNFDGDVPLPTEGRVSGLANGTYFWRVKGAQDLGGVTGFVDSPFSAVRSFTVTGLGPAPGIPAITSPANGASFHPVEFFDITWSEVVGAHHYLLEADEDSAFSAPINLGSDVVFGTRFHAGWGNPLNVFYRVRAVSVDGVWGRPSPTLTVHVTSAAPVPPPPVPLSPVGGATITLPFVFDWTDTPNPQFVGYDIDIDDEPNFLGAIGVLLVSQISRSDYMVVQDPLVEHINRIPPGTYFWRVRALHGDTFGPWSAGQRFVVAPSPATPPGLELFWILTDPGSVQGGNSTVARLALNGPAPAGGALIHLASDFPGIEIPATVLIPAGTTDAIVGPVTSPPVSGASISTLRAAYGLGWQQNSIGCFPILWGGALSAENVVGGSTVNGTVTLLGPAPAGGVVVSILDTNTAVAQAPATVLVPAGATSATLGITTSSVSVPTRVRFSFGTAFEGYHSPETWLVVTPPTSPAPPPAITALTLNPTAVPGGGSGTGTVSLTSAAPAGGLRIRLSGSSEGNVVVPAEVLVPAGSLGASFPITPPPVARPHWVIVQASVAPQGMLHAATLEVDPGSPGPSPLFAIDARPNGLIGGETSRGTVGLSVPAPPGGEIVSLVSSDSSVAQVPPSVTVAAGNSTASFTITTSSVASFSSASVTGAAGGASKTAFLSVGANPNAPLALLSITPSVSGAVGGNPINTTLFLNKSAPAGAVVTLSSSNPAAAQVPASVTVQAGLGFATFNITTSPVAVNTPVTITGTLGATQTAVITVLAPPNSLATLALGPASLVGGSTSSGTATLSSAAPSGGTVVTLSSSNPTVATVPASVTVAAGATSATFPVTTTPVASTTAVTISGAGGGVNRSATLTVTPSLAGFRGPTANSADIGGDGNGFEVAAANAQTDDGLNAVDNNGGTASTTSCTSTARDSHRFFNYGLGLPAGASVQGIEVLLDARADATTGAPKMCVQLSWNGGASWTTTHSTPTLTTGLTAYVLGGPADTWGRTWTSAELSDASFRVRVTDVASSTARDFSLDWIAVRVTTGNVLPTDTTPPGASVSSPAAGATLSGTVTISATASDNVGVSRVEFLVDGTIVGTDTTSPYSAAWNTSTATNAAHSLAARAFDAAGNQTTSTAVGVTVNNGSPPVLHITLSGVPTSIVRGQVFTATATVANAGGAAASGASVLIAFTPTDSMRLESPQGSTQSVASVAAGGTQSVSWQLRADRAAQATLTMTLRNSSGATVETATRVVTITN